MPAEQIELYSSPNGDRWLLRRDPATGNVFVRHEANIPSGGKLTDIGIGEFLSEGRRNPEHQALLQLIGTLVESAPQAARDISPAIKGSPSPPPASTRRR
jgi:hypothetical protein